MPRRLALWAAVLAFAGCSLKQSAPVPYADSEPPPGAAILEVLPTAIDFGTVDVGGDVEQTVTIANDGASALVVDDVRFTFADDSLAVSPSTPMTVAAGDAIDLSVLWSPTEVNDMQNALRIVSDDANRPVLEVALTGRTPAPQIQVSPLVSDFGAVALGSTLEMAVTIANAGDADLIVDSLEYLSSDPDDLGLDEPLGTPFVMVPGDFVGVRVSYTPTDEVDDHGVLTVESNDPNLPVVHAEQTGSVVPLPACVVASWTFEGDATDTSGNGNDAVVEGARLTADRNGDADHAYYFDGSTYLDVPFSTTLDAMEAGGQVTIAAWLSVDRWSVISGTKHFPVMEKYRASDDAGWELMVYGPGSGPYADLLTVWVPSYVPLSAGFEFEDDTWYFVAVTFDEAADEVRFYVDGAWIGTVASTKTLGPTDGGDVHIGWSLDGQDESAIGTIDDLYLFDCVLTDDDVASLYERE